MIMEIIICKSNKYLIKLLELLKVFFYSILFILILSSCKKIEKEIEKSQQELFLEKINALENSLTSDIDASILCPIFRLGSDNTDLQRERVVKEIKEKTVIWELQVYEVKSTAKSNVYRIQTSECTPKSESKTVNQLDEMGEEFLKAFKNELGLNSGGNNITNRNVATFIELFAKNEDDIRKINSLKTGDWIKVRGKITGTSFRSIELNPAIFWNIQKTSNQEGQINKNVNNTTDSGFSKNSKNESKNNRFENTYLQIDKEFFTKIKDSNRAMVVQIALMTQYDNRVFDNVKKHEFVIRSEISNVMRQTTEADISHPDFRANLASKIKDVINNILKEYEDFGGIEDVFFTSFVMQDESQ
jgi:flagellar basal body-associated protein FliL